MATHEIIYLVLALAIALILTSRAHHKGFAGLMLFWLLGYPIFSRPEYMLSIRALGFDLQPNRLLLLLLAPAVVWRTATARLHIPRPRPPAPPRPRSGRWFEVAMLVYALVAVVALLSNAPTIGPARALAMASAELIFPVVYITSRWNANQHDFHVLVSGIFVLAFASSLVALVQFFGDPGFFRFGVERAAFGKYVRANGVFAAEYLQGMFLVFALLLVLYVQPPKWIIVPALCLFPMAIFLTMHRLSWICLTVMAILYMFNHLRSHRAAIMPAVVGAAISILMMVLVVGIASGAAPVLNAVADLFSQRIQDDSLTTRAQLNQFGLDLIAKYPGGIGTFWSSTYDQEIYAHALPMTSSGGGTIVHNGFIAAGVKSGVLGLFGFALLMLTLIQFFAARVQSRDGRTLVPLLIVLAYAIFNISNDFSSIGEQMGVFLALLVGYLSVIAHLSQTATRACSWSAGQLMDVANIGAYHRQWRQSAR